MNLKVVNLSGYEIPKVKEVHNKSWVEYGDGNNYFGELIERYLGSPTNSRCINGISDMIYGRGLEALDSKDKPQMYANMKMLLRQDCVKKVSTDLKMLGQAAIQVVYKNRKREIASLHHFPMETLRAEKAKSGKIEAYYYHADWSNIKPSDKPKRIPTFRNGTRSQRIELYIIKPYKAGFYYYSPVDYQGCLQYASLEEEVSNYHLSNIENGLQPSMLINFNNGIPNEESQENIERKIYEKFSGSSNAGRFILAFNEDKDSQSQIDPINLPDAHAQYEFLAKESREKIMIGHGVVSPILLGIKDNTGFGNNAEELRTASILMDNMVIRPFQQLLIDSFKELLAFNGIDLNLYFVTLQPIEFTELDNIATKIKREEETGEKLSAVEKNELSEDEGDDLLSQLESLGEIISDDWEIIYTEDVTESNIEFDVTKLSSVSESDAKPKQPSFQDNSGYKVRYRYKEVVKSTDSRRFCSSMMNFSNKGLVFRIEDINMMSFRGVNKQHGHKGRNYSLLKWQGGVNCKHIFERVVYAKKNRVSEDKAISKGFTPPNNPDEMTEANWTRADKGRHPNSRS
jgi:hypothetical protein